MVFKRWCSKLSYFIFIAIFLVLSNRISLAQFVDDETLFRIKTELSITNVNDDSLRMALSNEIEPGIILADQLIAILDQVNFGLQLKSGNYFTRYQDYFNFVLDKNLNLYDYYKTLGRDAIIAWVANYFNSISGGTLGGLLGTTSGVLFTTLKVIEIDGAFLALISQIIDNYLYNYIDSRQSGDNDETAWNFIQPIPLNLSDEEWEKNP